MCFSPMVAKRKGFSISALCVEIEVCFESRVREITDTFQKKHCVSICSCVCVLCLLVTVMCVLCSLVMIWCVR